MRKDPYNVRLSGKGGQGVLLAGIILAEAGMRDGLNVVQSQTYGPQARLGASKCEVILSTHPIAFPEVETPDLWLCLSAEAFEKHRAAFFTSGVLLLDERVVQDKSVTNGFVLPILAAATEAGNVIAANMVALGAIAAMTEVVSRPSLVAAMKARVKPAYLDLNRNALEIGFNLASRTDGIFTGTR